jgi:hypothetical protein
MIRRAKPKLPESAPGFNTAELEAIGDRIGAFGPPCLPPEDHGPAWDYRDGAWRCRRCDYHVDCVAIDPDNLTATVRENLNAAADMAAHAVVCGI